MDAWRDGPLKDRRARLYSLISRFGWQLCLSPGTHLSPHDPYDVKPSGLGGMGQVPC